MPSRVSRMLDLELRLLATKSMLELHLLACREPRNQSNLGPYLAWLTLFPSPSLIVGQRGDLWNDEDLSIFSRDQMNASSKDPVYNGGRALPAVVRPYARKVAGQPLDMHFDLHSRIFTFSFQAEKMKSRNAPTEIFVPLYQYPDGISFDATPGLKVVDHNELTQTLAFSHDEPGVVHSITIRPRDK